MPRVIPVLLLSGSGLVKTSKFEDPVYLGDPRNIVRIFNEKEVDEVVLLDVEATNEGRAPRFSLVEEIVSEAFFPLAYGGGIRELEDAREVLRIGVEKVVICTAACEKPTLVRQLANEFGNQSVAVCIDARKRWFGKYEVYSHGGRRATGERPTEFAVRMEKHGAGEIMVNSIDRDGTMAGYDLSLVRGVSSAVGIPVIASGGAGGVSDLALAVREGGASAVAAGSLFVFRGRHRAVLISYPSREELSQAFLKLPSDAATSDRAPGRDGVGG